MSARTPGFQRSDRDGVTTFGGRDHLVAMGWWILVALVGGGVAFLGLDPLGPAVTGGFAVGAIVLGFLGQLTARFELRLGPDGPMLRYRLLGLTLRRLLLPKAVQARVMGLGDYGDGGSDSRNVATELFLEGARLDELWVGARADAPALAPALQGALRARYGAPDERLERLGHNTPLGLRPLRWAQGTLGWFRPRIVREGGLTRVELPMVGLEDQPADILIWGGILAASTALAAAAPALELGPVWSWVGAAVAVVSAAFLIWPAALSMRLELGREPGLVHLQRRRFGLASGELALRITGWYPRHRWWCGHPSAVDFHDADPPEAGSPESVRRLKFGSLRCASAWPLLPELPGLLDAAVHPSATPEPAAAAERGEGRRRRRRRKR